MRFRRQLVAALILIPATLSPSYGQALDATVADSVEGIFAERAGDSFVAVVLDDPANRRYLAFYMSRYLELRELRAYLIPYASADRPTVTAALEAGDEAAAFTSLLSTMRLTSGAKYVSDVNLDGINADVIELGEGTIRDGFHPQIFPDHAAADAAYRQWLSRALELRGS